MTYLKMSAILIILASPISMANSVADTLLMCAENVDSLQRLVCYDKLAKKIKNFPSKLQEMQAQFPVRTTTSGTSDKPHQTEHKVQPKPVLAPSKRVAESLTVTKKIVVIKDDTTSQQQAIFGKENKQSIKNTINQIKSKILKVHKDRFGNQTISLANGQVWRQTDNTRLKLKREQIVIIKRGAMGSFFIGKENANKRIRAKRVK